ncbi:MAG: response regulator transcription factor [Phaeodactylibacter sp.]|nr:response regulator transcription factor [Phaeodactylibacter sp.]MCB9296841.1 response regulator transcription factor [Lewinellaceae bacterium]
MAKILLIEDNETLGYALKEYLELKGFELAWRKDAEQGLAYFERYPASLCLVDVMMPGTDGFGLAAEIRRRSPKMPLIFLTARGLKADILKGFGLGADDYIVKPVDEEELAARIRAVLRRANGPEAETARFRIGAYHFDPANQKLCHGGTERLLTEREARLLHLLCEHKGQLLPRQEVLRNLWRQNDYFTRRSMDVFISRLRRYLAEDPNIEIKNVYGSGFILVDGVREGGKEGQAL